MLSKLFKNTFWTDRKYFTSLMDNVKRKNSTKIAFVVDLTRKKVFLSKRKFSYILSLLLQTIPT